MPDIAIESHQAYDATSIPSITLWKRRSAHGAPFDTHGSCPGPGLDAGRSRSKRIHITAEIVEQTFTGIANPAIGDRLITSAKLFDKHDETEQVGTGAGVCTVVSAPETFSAKDTVIQCLISAVFDQGNYFWGAVQFPEVGAVGQFSILGGTGNFAKPAAKRRSLSSRPHFRMPCSSLSSDTWAKPVR